MVLDASQMQRDKGRAARWIAQRLERLIEAGEIASPIVVMIDSVPDRQPGDLGPSAFPVVRRRWLEYGDANPFGDAYLSWVCDELKPQIDASYRTLAADLLDEAVIHFVDNTGALSNLIHGYAARPDCGRLTNAFHLTLARLRCMVWLEWVPSKANVADYPSRDDDSALLDALDGAGLGTAFDEVDFDLPEMASWSAPLASFAAP